uniref:Uncharacterized protein n=1 Tax=Anopheles melas TaxID=34690 RepID=A0A182UD26_9DIPT
METIKTLLLQSSPGAGPTINTDPDYAPPHRKTMQDPFESSIRGRDGLTLSPLIPAVTSVCESDDGMMDDSVSQTTSLEGWKEESTVLRTTGGVDFIHPKLSKLKQPPVIVGVAVKRSLRKPPEVITNSVATVTPVTQPAPIKSSTLERWHKDIFETPSTALPHDGWMRNKTEESFSKSGHHAEGDELSIDGGEELKIDRPQHCASAVNEVVDNGEEIGPKDNGSDNDLIDLIDFSSDQEEPAAEPNDTPVQKTLAKESNWLLEATPPETQIGPVSGSGRVKKVTFLLDDDPFRHYDSDNGSNSVKHPRGESDLPDSEVSEKEVEEEEGEETARINGEVLDIDTESVCEQWVSVDESDPTSSGRKVTPKHHPPCLLRNEISTETGQTDDSVLRAADEAAGRSGVNVNRKQSAAESGHVDSEAAGRWSPQRLRAMDGDEHGASEHDAWLETEMVQRACSSPLHAETGGHGARASRADVCRANACAGTESINGERHRKHQHQQGSLVKHDPHDGGLSVKGRPEASDDGSSSSSSSSCDERGVVTLSNVKLSSVPIDEQLQHAGSDIEVCCIDGRDLQTHHEHDNRGQGVQRVVTPANAQQWPVTSNGRVSATSQRWNSSAGECERIDERCYVDDGGEGQHQQRPESTSLLRGLECVSASSLPWQAVGPSGEDEEVGKRRSKGLGQQRQLAPNGAVARTVQTCPTECEEKSTQVSAKGHGAQTTGPLSSDSESENYYGTCSPPTVEGDREGDDDSDGSSSRTGVIQSRTGHRNNPSSADSGIIIIDDDVDGGAASDERSFPCQQRVGDEQGGVSIVKGPGERRDQHQGTQTGSFVEQFIDSEIRPQGLPDHGPEQEVCEGVSVGERVQSDSRSKSSSTVSVSIEGYHPAQDNTSDRASGEAAEAPSGGVECFEASQRLKRLEERFRGFAYTKKLFRESLSHDTPGLGAGGARRYGEAPRSVGGSLPSLLQDATRDEDDTESYLLSNSKSHGSNRAPHATSQPSPSTSLNRTARASWTRPILPPLSSSLLSLSASSLLSLSCLDLARQSRQRTASQEPSCTDREGEIAEGHGEGQEKNNNSRAEENGLSKAVSLPSLLAPVVQQQGPSECIVETVRGSAADTVSPARCGSTADTIPLGSRNQLLRYQRQPRAVEELRRNTDTPESSGAESEEICKIFPGGKARVADPLEVVETVVIGGSTEEEDNDDDDDDEEEEEEDDVEEDTSGHIVLSGVGEDILNNNHRHYLGGEEADTVRGDEFGRLEKLLAADPHTNCEFDTRHLQDYEPEVYRIKYCYDELEEELEEQQERAAANDLLVVLRGPARPLPVGPPPAVPPPPPKGARVVLVGDRQSAIYSTPRFGATVSGAEVQCSGAEGRAVGTRGEASAATVLPVSLARIADADSSEPGSAGVLVVNGPASVTGGSASGSVKTGEAEDRDIPPPPPPPKARAGVARSFDGCGCVIEAIPLYRSEAEAFAAGGGAMRETATGTLRGLLKKPNRPPPVRKNRVVFDETRNEFFEADYIILIREDCPYDEEDEEPCTCGEHELVRICCDEGCNCGYTDDGRTPPPAVIARGKSRPPPHNRGKAERPPAQRPLHMGTGKNRNTNTKWIQERMS